MTGTPLAEDTRWVSGRLFQTEDGVRRDVEEMEGGAELVLAPFTPAYFEGRPGMESHVSVDWGEVYRATFQELVRFLHRKVWDAERARDLAQEVFVRALRHDPEEPRAWVFKVALNLARDEARTVLRRKRHLALLKSEGEEGRRSPSPEEELATRERWRGVRQALESLSERDREVLLLWDAGLSYREISEVTDLAPGAVGTTLARARQRLVEAHGEWEKEHAAHN